MIQKTTRKIFMLQKEWERYGKLTGNDNENVAAENLSVLIEGMDIEHEHIWFDRYVDSITAQFKETYQGFSRTYLIKNMQSCKSRTVDPTMCRACWELVLKSAPCEVGDDLFKSSITLTLNGAMVSARRTQIIEGRRWRSLMGMNWKLK